MSSVVFRQLPRYLRRLSSQHVQVTVFPCTHEECVRHLHACHILKQVRKPQEDSSDNTLDVKRENPYEHLSMGQRGMIAFYLYLSQSLQEIKIPYIALYLFHMNVHIEECVPLSDFNIDIENRISLSCYLDDRIKGTSSTCNRLLMTFISS